MSQTIFAKVSKKLLSKACRLFTGSLDGRIIEILQNARRAGATEVRITNRDGFITVQDNGCGIDDFQQLLGLGDSGWDERLEAGEDPAGVGLFSLAPSEVQITSANKKAVIDKDGWTGRAVEVTRVNEYVAGTIVRFKDEKPWDMETVEKHAVFAGIRVIVDGKYCHQMPFCPDGAGYYQEPGCRIEVTTEISKYHRLWVSNWYKNPVLVNFHGQVVQFDYWPGKSSQNLKILVDIADQTNIRLMLPARTQLVQNQAFVQLKAAIELAYYRYFQSRKTHCLYYSEYLRAKELGIELPEAEPKYGIGLLYGDYNEPVAIEAPRNFELSDGYLFFDSEFYTEAARPNAHLLAALGDFKDRPFVPVTIEDGYMGYSWSQLPKVLKVEVTKEGQKLRRCIECDELACFDKLQITVFTSDGKVYSSDVGMAITISPLKDKYCWPEKTVCLTKESAKRLSAEEIWFHLGGYNDGGDSYETQLYYFEKELRQFWAELAGPYEGLRNEIFTLLTREYNLYGKWDRITVFADQSMDILLQNGTRQTIRPPVESA